MPYKDWYQCESCNYILYDAHNIIYSLESYLGQCLSRQLNVPYWWGHDWFSQLGSFYCFVMEIKFESAFFIQNPICLFWRTWECEVKHKHGKEVLGGKADIKISMFYAALSRIYFISGPFARLTRQKISLIKTLHTQGLNESMQEHSRQTTVLDVDI